MGWLIMKNIHNISTLTLSRYINLIRSFLILNNFFEHHLYSTTPYKIENTETFKLKDSLFLRYNPEPDIWSVREKYNNFFWIGSMFRNERKLTPLHRNEFTVVDIYMENKEMSDVLKLFNLLL